MSTTTLYRDDHDRFGIAHGDALDLLVRLPAASVDAIVTDPPYGIGFNRESWDRPGLSASVNEAAGFGEWTSRWAAEARRVLKPGGYLVAFGAPRTFHRLTVGVEDAGFEVRDVVMWLCGQGVPKGRRLPGGFSTTLRPGYEPILVARAPLPEGARRLASGVLAVGEGRWPQNVAMTHTTLCHPDRCSRRCPARILDRAQRTQRPSRFFYAAKASRREREAGLDHLKPQGHVLFGPKRENARPKRNAHPTVKPVELMRWLVRLVCPEEGVVLDPFAGSGSTGVAAVLEDRGFIGIEREPEYVEIALSRLTHWSRER
jgi:site-specific DNA-methyltransferase (adenine-specific)